MPTFNNPIAYYMAARSQNVDSLNRTAVSTTTVYNGSLVTLAEMNTGAAAGMNYVFPATLTAATDGNVANVWMVRAPEVPMDVCGNLYDDPRAFSVEAGRPFDVIRPEVGDIVKLSAAAFGANTQPSTANKYVFCDENGEWQAAASAAGKTGLVGKFQMNEAFVVGQESVPGFIIEIIQNPTETLA